MTGQSQHYGNTDSIKPTPELTELADYHRYRKNSNPEVPAPDDVEPPHHHQISKCHLVGVSDLLRRNREFVVHIHS